MEEKKDKEIEALRDCIWIIADIMSVPLYIEKGYYISVVQFMVFIVIAIMGYFEWKKQIDRS